MNPINIANVEALEVKVAALEEELSIWKSVFPDIAPRDLISPEDHKISIKVYPHRTRRYDLVINGICFGRFMSKIELMKVVTFFCGIFKELQLKGTIPSYIIIESDESFDPVEGFNYVAENEV